MTTPQIISIAVFTVVMALVVSEKIHRALAALLGAVVLFCIGIVDFDAGMGSIDFNTLGVLCGMMMFVAGCASRSCSNTWPFGRRSCAKATRGRSWPRSSSSPPCSRRCSTT